VCNREKGKRTGGEDHPKRILFFRARKDNRSIEECSSELLDHRSMMLIFESLKISIARVIIAISRAPLSQCDLGIPLSLSLSLSSSSIDR